MELEELEVGDRSARADRRGDAVRGRDRRVRRVRVELARAAGGEDDGVGRDLLAATPDGGGLGGRRPVADEQVDAADASVPDHEIHQERVLDDAHAAGPEPRDERLLDRGARGIPARVQDARIRVRRLETLDERALGVAVERDAEVDEFADARGALVGEHAHGGRGH